VGLPEFKAAITSFRKNRCDLSQCLGGDCKVNDECLRLADEVHLVATNWESALFRRYGDNIPTSEEVAYLTAINDAAQDIVRLEGGSSGGKGFVDSMGPEGRNY